MTKHTVKKLIPMSRDEYWKIVFTDEFDTFTAPYLKFKKIETETQPSDDPNIIKRTANVYPDYDIPHTLLHLLGQAEFHYVDHQEKNLTAYTMNSNTLPPLSHHDILKISTHQYIEANDDHSCYHVLETEIHCSVWGLGHLVEKAIIHGVEQGYDLLPKAVEAYLAHLKEEKEHQPVDQSSSISTAMH